MEWERGSSPSDGARQPPTGLPAGALLSHDVPRGWLIRSLSSVRSCRTEGRAGPSSGVDASEHRAAALAVETAPGRPGKGPQRASSERQRTREAEAKAARRLGEAPLRPDAVCVP